MTHTQKQEGLVKQRYVNKGNVFDNANLGDRLVRLWYQPHLVYSLGSVLNLSMSENPGTFMTRTWASWDSHSRRSGIVTGTVTYTLSSS